MTLSFDPDRAARRLSALRAAEAVVTALLGGWLFAAWLIGAESWSQVGNSAPTQPNTAFCLFALGVALGLRCAEGILPAPLAGRGSVALAAMTAVLAAVTLIPHPAGTESG